MPMIPLSQLPDYVDVPEGTDTQAFVAVLIKVGLKEEEVHPARVTGPLAVGRVLTRVGETASNDKIVNYCRADIGEYNDAPGTGKKPSDPPSRGIICGARNSDADDLAIVSLPGAILPEDFQIAVRKTYDCVSDGMIYSARELGLGEDHDGIIVLSKYFPDREIPVVGTDIVTRLDLGEGVLRINVAPDRDCCFSIHGIACKYSHLTGTPFHGPSLPGVIAAEPPTVNSGGFPVAFSDDVPTRDRVGVDRFVTRVVHDTGPSAPTPYWVVERLEAAGVRSVSLAVNITNYAILDLGQPIYAYNLDALAAPIVVRHARAGETLVTLDEEKRELDPQDLLVIDSSEGEGSRIIGIIGVMGGAYSGVGEGTTDVLFGVARFDSASVACSSRRYKLHSEAAKRLERGTDPQLPAVTTQRAVGLLLGYGGGTVDAGATDVDQRGRAVVTSLPVGEVGRLTDVARTPERVVELLHTVGYAVKGPGNGTSMVTASSWRPDFTFPANLVEEVARFNGYGNIPVVMPIAPVGHSLIVTQRVCRLAATTLAGGGLVEVESYPFVSDTWDCQGIPANDLRREAMCLCDPIADDVPWLCITVLNTLLDVADRNVPRSNADAAIFEAAKIARPTGTIPADLPSAEERPFDGMVTVLEAGILTQPWYIGGVLTDQVVLVRVLVNAHAYDWADALEYVHRVASDLGARVGVTRAWMGEMPVYKDTPMPAPAIDPAAAAPFHPSRIARVFVCVGRDFVDVAFTGESLPAACRAFGLPARPCVFEIDTDALISQVSEAPIQVKDVSTFPLAREDIALVVPSGIPASRVEQIVHQGAGQLIRSVTLFDIYEGDQVPEGHRSLAFTLRLRVANYTLTAKESLQVCEQVVAKAAKVLGASLRA